MLKAIGDEASQEVEGDGVSGPGQAQGERREEEGGGGGEGEEEEAASDSSSQQLISKMTPGVSLSACIICMRHLSMHASLALVNLSHLSNLSLVNLSHLSNLSTSLHASFVDCPLGTHEPLRTCQLVNVPSATLTGFVCNNHSLFFWHPHSHRLPCSASYFQNPKPETSHPKLPSKPAS
jgi:hypothetical protein